MMNKVTIEDENGNNINISVIGNFRVPGLNKEYIMYSMMDENKENEMGAVLIGELIRKDDEPLKVVGIDKGEHELIVAYYNEIFKEMGV